MPTWPNASRRTRAVAALAGLLLAVPAMAARPLPYGAVTDAELASCDEAAWRGDASASGRCYGNLLAAAEPDVRAEAAWALGDRQAANRWFRDALKQRPDDLDVKTRWGELFASTHQDAEAMALFNEVLADDPNHPFAVVGAATVLAESFESDAEARIAPLLADADEAPGARLRAALLRARFALERGELDDAADMLDLAEQIAETNSWPTLDVLALRIAHDLLGGGDGSEALAAGRAINENYGPLYTEAAYFLTITRFYRRAIGWLENAVGADPRRARAHEMLGVNLLRDNRIGAARQHLETAYELDPFSPVAVNTLRLIDSFDRFDLIRDAAPTTGRYAGQPPLELRLRNDEAAVLAPLTIELTRQAIDVFTRRYRFRLAEPVVIEMYPDHDDFAVRTAGMPGLGILGATFGYVVAMDSPSGRSISEFQWGTVLWHELAHVFTLEATGHRVPRWFSEGISVYEEWVSGPNPGVRVPPGVFAQIGADKMLPVADLDAGFVRPTYPNQVIVSYMQAGLICLYVAERFGEPALADLVDAYTDGATTTAAITRVLDVSPSEFDRAFADWVEQHYGALYNDLDHWRQTSELAASALAAKDYDNAIDAASEALELYPGYVEPDSAYLTLARAALARDNRALAESTFDRWLAQGGYDPAAIIEYANALYDDGTRTKAADVLARVRWVAPLAAEPAMQLAEWRLELGDGEAALAALTRVLALNPHDRARVLYLTARAHALTGDRTAAQSTLLDALDIAPDYRDAQKFLLELVRAGS